MRSIAPHTRLVHQSFASAARPTAAAGSSAGTTRSPPLPDNQQDSTLADALRAIVELDLSELRAVEPPRGLGRD